MLCRRLAPARRVSRRRRQRRVPPRVAPAAHCACRRSASAARTHPSPSPSGARAYKRTHPHHPLCVFARSPRGVAARCGQAVSPTRRLPSGRSRRAAAARRTVSTHICSSSCGRTHRNAARTPLLASGLCHRILCEGTAFTPSFRVAHTWGEQRGTPGAPDSSRRARVPTLPLPALPLAPRAAVVERVTRRAE